MDEKTANEGESEIIKFMLPLRPRPAAVVPHAVVNPFVTPLLPSSVPVHVETARIWISGYECRILSSVVPSIARIVHPRLLRWV